MHLFPLGPLNAFAFFLVVVEARRVVQIRAADASSRRGSAFNSGDIVDTPPRGASDASDQGANGTSGAIAEPAAAVHHEEPNCTELGSLKVGEEDLGASLLLVCQHWDSQAWGAFPVHSLRDAEALFSAAVSAGGLHDQVKELQDQRTNSTEFCWKRQTLRPLQKPTGYHCPEVFNSAFAAEVPKKAQPHRRSILDGTLVCRKSCADICGTAPLLANNSASGTCLCLDTSLDGGQSELTLLSTVNPQPEGCDAVRFGECYDKCPTSFKPAFIVGQVFPVCNVVCGSTEMKTDCGLGCASSVGHCASKVVNEIDEIVRAVAHGTEILSGQHEITATADALVGVVEFAESVVGKVAKSAQDAVTGVQQKQWTAGLMASLLHIAGGADVRQAIEDFSSGTQVLPGKYSQFVSLFGTYLHQLGETKVASAKDIGRTFLAQGTSAVVEVNGLLKAFLWPTCEVSMGTPQDISPGDDDPRASMNCSELPQLMIGSRDVGRTLRLVCEMWPSSLGKFPVQTVADAQALLQDAFKPGGAYEQAASLVKQRVRSKNFCWRRNERRTHQEPTGYTCPTIFNDFWSSEWSAHVEPTQVDRRWLCQKSCDDVCGVGNGDETSGEQCECKEDFRPGGDIVRKLRVLRAKPMGCAQVVGHECFGECPQGMSRTSIVGEFAPVCTTKCSNSSHPVECGFGCADDRSMCKDTVVKQVEHVVRAIGQSASYISGDPRIMADTDALISIAEFAVAVVGELAQSVLKAGGRLQEDGKKVGFLAALLQTLGEEDFSAAAEDVVHDVAKLRAKYATTLELFGDIASVFSTWRWSKAGDVAKAIFKNNVAAIAQVSGLLDAFFWPKCGAEAAAQLPEPAQEESLTTNTTTTTTTSAAAPGPEPPAVTSNVTDCEDLANYTLHGHDVGNILALICEEWPESWGQFPIDTVHDIEVVVNTTFHPGGMLDQMKALIEARRTSGSFCWKHNELRLEQEPTDGYRCPIFFSSYGLEKAVDIAPQQKDGKWLCEKFCEDICGEVRYIGEVKIGVCGCMDWQYDQVFPVPAVRRATPQGCKMVHQDNCYGECAEGFSHSFLLGKVLPVCQLHCESTAHKHECGFGCANSSEACAKSSVEQVAEVFRVAGETAAFAAGHPEVAISVDALVSVFEFAMDIVGKLIKAVVASRRDAKDHHRSASVLAALLHLVDNSESRKNLKELKTTYQKFMKLFAELAASMKEMQWLKAGKVARIFLKHGAEVIVDIYKVVHAFVWPRCELQQSPPAIPTEGTTGAAEDLPTPPTDALPASPAQTPSASTEPGTSTTPVVTGEHGGGQ